MKAAVCAASFLIRGYFDEKTYYHLAELHALVAVVGVQASSEAI